MANSKLLLASIAIALVIVGVRSHPPIEGEIAAPDASGSALRLEIEALRSKISTLESSIEERIRELKTKEDNVGQLNDIIQEKLSRISSLESEIESVQGSVDANKLAGKADSRVVQLEKQVVKLRNEIEGQSNKRDALAARASKAENKIQELNLRLEGLQRTNEEQKLRIRIIQRALELAEEELMRAQLEAASKLKDLTMVHVAWLPHWFTTHSSRIQDLVVTHWNKHAKPALVLIQHKEWIPAAKEQLIIFKSNAEPYLQKAYAQAIELYEASKRTFAPQVVKLQEVAHLYFQEARELSKPYIDQGVIGTKPHVEKLQLVLMPYTKHMVRVYRKSLRRARSYHRQVQQNIQEQLKKHELTKPHASKELAWFMATALLALPILFLYRVIAAGFSKKAKKPKRTSHASHTHRRAKRRHAEK